MSSMINLYTIIGVIGLFFAYIFLRGKKSDCEIKNKTGEIYLIYKNDEKIRIALEAVSRINGEYEEIKEKRLKIQEKIEEVKNQGVNLEFEEISKYCKKKDEKEGDQFYYIPNNPYLRKFQEDILLNSSYYSDNIAFVIDEILRLLDTKGDCSSVVQTEIKEIAKTDKDKTTYNLLSQIDLARHSVNVAMNMYRRHSDGIKMLKAVVIGLTHDIGKIPEFYKEYSGVGKHNFISTLVINQIQHFNKIGIFEDIKDIIRQHHDYPKSDKDNIMLVSLREADYEARRSEIYYIDEKIKSESLNPINTVNYKEINFEENKGVEVNEPEIKEFERAKNVSEENERGDNKDGADNNGADNNEANNKLEADNNGADNKLEADQVINTDKVTFSKEEIRGFFEELLKHINVFQSGSGDSEKMLFFAFTCPKKNIFFQPNLAINILSSLYPDKTRYLVDRKDEQKFLNSFMDGVRENYPDAVNSKNINKNYFGNYFTLYKENNEEKQMFLMTVNALIYKDIDKQKEFEEADQRKKDTIIEDIKYIKVSGKKRNIKPREGLFDDQITNTFGNNL